MPQPGPISSHYGTQSVGQELQLPGPAVLGPEAPDILNISYPEIQETAANETPTSIQASNTFSKWPKTYVTGASTFLLDVATIAATKMIYDAHLNDNKPNPLVALPIIGAISTWGAINGIALYTDRQNKRYKEEIQLQDVLNTEASNSFIKNYWRTCVTLLASSGVAAATILLTMEANKNDRLAAGLWGGLAGVLDVLTVESALIAETQGKTLKGQVQERRQPVA
jgi:hypothetical protein